MLLMDNPTERERLGVGHMARIEDARRSRGFTMVETIVVVAITVILMGVAFVTVANYRRSMLQLELDATAKEVYMAAQNHLFTAMEQGLLETYDAEARGTKEDSETDVYYFVVTPATVPTPSTTLGLMLPFGSVDETVRTGGSYIIRYQPSTGRILDVFYASPTGLGGLFGGFGGYTFVADSDEYKAVIECAGANKASERRNYKGAVIGYYGGEETADAAIVLKAPSVKVENGDKLMVTVYNPAINRSRAGSNLQLRLIVEGKESKAMMCFNLVEKSDGPDETYDSEKYSFCLDDVTGMYDRFSELCSSCFNKDGQFIPGENLKIYAWVTASGTFANVAKSASATANSLFANKSGATDEEEYTAKIANFRHLINLGESSGFNWDPTADKDRYQSVQAIQKTDLVWIGTDDDPGFVDNNYEDRAQPLTPVDPQYALAYDGFKYAISNVLVDESGSEPVDGGLFEALIDGSSVSNLELVNTRVTTSKGFAGALVGKAAGDLTLTNVIAHDTDGEVGSSIKGTEAVGGLVGSVGKITIDGCAAAVYVEATGPESVAGGLIGEISGSNVSVENCYAGGHTQKGLYKDDAINVKAVGIAGGLIGSASGSVEIKSSYATTSVSADTTVGGFVGKAPDATITDCYATGLVTGGDAGTEGAFAGSEGAEFTDCQYFEIINEDILIVGGKTGKIDGISAIDEDEDSYNTFFQASDVAADAQPYDSEWLKERYGDKYPYPSVIALRGSTGESSGADGPALEDCFVAKHYGDWPSPETLVINWPSPETLVINEKTGN